MKGKIICNVEIKNIQLWVEGSVCPLAIKLSLIKDRCFFPVLEYEVLTDFNCLINSDLVSATASVL